MKKKLRNILICFIPVYIWLICLTYCEVNTLLHGEEFEGEYMQTNMIAGNPACKVLKYSEEEAKVYYADRSGGDVILFEHADGKWMMKEWETIWSNSGSADGIIWPYIR